MSRKKILFLDFDGVLVDSSRETARTGWLAGSEIWEEWKGLDIPPGHISKFRQLRPLLETGYEAIALVKAIDEGYSDSFLKEKFSFMMEQIFTSVSMNREKLIKLFGKVRDDWTRIDFRGWIKWHSFYSCSPDILQCASELYRRAFIVTTKEKRFTEKLMLYSGLDFDQGLIFGLESGQTKEAVISSIIESEKISPENAVIVEDRLETLYSFSGSERLSKALLCLASWGFVFPEDAAELERKESVIKVLEVASAARELEKAASV